MADPIEHVIVLMLENRSFDHFFGAVPGINGINPANPNSNLERPGSATRFPQTPDAVRKMRPDPRHEFTNVMRQIAPGHGLPAMGGFVWDLALEQPNAGAAWPQVMSYFGLGALSATHQLAQAFCVCDPWFSSVPGPTWTNRFFVHSGTSQGWVNMPQLPFHLNLHKYDQTTVYDRLNERNVDWAIYAGDIPQSLLLNNQRMKGNLKHYHMMSTFFKDVAAAANDASGFPKYTFIEPSYMPFGQNDQHPPHDVLKGDALIASVYNAVRGSQALWDSTLLIVTWDEHGGFYDHVQPPAAVPPDHNNQEGCNFDLYGVRVGTILISKWLRGPRFAPADGKVLDHTSILRYLTDKYGLGPLGNRTASAASFAGAIGAAPNENTPARVGMAPLSLAMTAVDADNAEPDELNKNQACLIEFSKQLEAQMAAPAADVGMRALRAATGVQGEVEAAKERIWLYIDKQSQ
jgi:phospholipase C